MRHLSIAASAMLFALPFPVSAADQKSSVQALLQQGYQIRGASFVPQADVKALYGEASAASMVVTLQKEQSVAVCEFNWGNWSALAQATYENPELCRVR